MNLQWWMIAAISTQSNINDHESIDCCS